jgi:crotonobetainyl-CoA:carnitine CoA-transferase CaiB-like acyl-CoA transferase
MDTYRPRDDEPGPLSGIRVLDLSQARSGPTCARQLADFGAEVIQVQNPKRGDLPGSDGYNLQRAKRSLLLDLKHPAGRETFLRVAARADVLVENFRPGVSRRLGIDFETLAPLYPRLIYASISGFGQDGPIAERRGLDQIAQGMGGVMSVTGPPGTGPWRTGIAISDTASGTFLTQGVLAALFARERTGRGQWVHTSLLESMVNFMDFQAARWLVDGEVPGQAGNDHPTIFPMGTYRTRDGYLNIAAVMDFERFLGAIDARELARDPRFAEPRERARNRDALHALVEAKLAVRCSAEWVELLSREDIPCGPVYALDQVFADPQVQHLRLTRQVPGPPRAPAHRRLELLRHPVTFSETPAGVRGGPPSAGADTRAVLRESGLADSEIDRLIAEGVAAEQGSGAGPFV